MDADYPKLRPVEAIAVQDNQICLRDPLGFSDKIVFLTPDIFFIVSLFDGKHSILDIQAAYTRQFGDLLFSDRVKAIIEQLDGCLLLESARFHEVQERAIAQFKSAPVRPASHAGISYERDADALRTQLEELFNNVKELGEPYGISAATGVSSISGADASSAGAAEASSLWLKGLIAPHIDIHRGGLCFAESYAELLRSSKAKTFIILGIAHMQTKRRFVLTDKGFDTPLGVMPSDRELIGRIVRNCSTDFFADEFSHRNEHSVEFQAVFLRYIYRGRDDVRIVPVLCSSYEQIYGSGLPDDDPEFNEFTAALVDACRERGDDICFIAGVDLSHLGRRFGQDMAMSTSVLRQAEEEDMRMIEKILAFDAEGFFRLIQDEKDRRNVCGVPAVYTMLSLMNALSARLERSSRLLKYDQSVDTATQSVVTFMGAAFYG